MIHAIALSLCLFSQNAEQTPASIQGGVWYPRLGGTMLDGGGTIDFETNIDLRRKETTPLVEFTLTPVPEINVSLSVFDFSTSGSGTFVGTKTFGAMTMSSGDSWVGSTNIQSVGFEAAWNVFQPYKASKNLTLTFAPVGGLRWFGIDTSLENTSISQTVSHSNSWLSLQAGMQMQFKWDTKHLTDFVDAISIDTQLLAGTMLGNDGGAMWSIRAGLTLQFSPTITGYFGYRLQEMNADDGTYTFDAGLQGLFVGGGILF